MAYNLKDANEVKEYIENLYTEYTFSCYSEKQPEACHLLGDYMDGIQNKIEEAAKIYKFNCDQYNFGKSCGKYGGYVAAGRGVEKDPKAGYTYLKKACELKDAKACFMAGSLLISDEDIGIDKPTKVKEGIEYLTKSCDEYKTEYACSYLAGIYLGSLKDHVEPDFKKAYHYSLKSCDSGNPYSCANVAQMYMKGDGTEKNLELAETFKVRAKTLYNAMAETQKLLKVKQETKTV